MRIIKAILALTLLSLAISATAQTAIPNTTQGTVNQNVLVNGGWGSRNYMRIPIKDTTTVWTNVTDSGRITIQPSTGILYWHNGVNWLTISAGSVYTAGYGLNLTGLQFKADTTVLVSKAFLTAMLVPYIKWSDTATVIATQPYVDNAIAGVPVLDSNRFARADSIVYVNQGFEVGNLFSDNFNRASIGSNYTTSLSTASISFPSSAYMQVSGGADDYNNSIIYNVTNSGSNQLTTTVTFVPVTVSSTSTGISIGMKSLGGNTVGSSMVAQFSAKSGASYGKMDYRLSDTLGIGFTGLLTVSAGDTLIGKLVQIDTNINIIYKNLTTGDSVTMQYGYQLATTTTPVLHRTCQIGLFILGSDAVRVLNWTFTDNSNTRNDLIIGDSYSQGYRSGSSSANYLNRLYQHRNDYSFYGGSGENVSNTLTGINLQLASRHRKIFIQLGSNDVFSLTPAAFSASYDTLVKRLDSTGLQIYGIGLVPLGLGNGIIYNDSIQAILTRYGHTYIDVHTPLLARNTTNSLNPNYNAGDNLHLNAVGQLAYAKVTQPYVNRYSGNDGNMQSRVNTLISNEATNTTAIALKADKSTTISTTSPLSGGGDLSDNRTLVISQATTSTNGYLSSTDWNTFNNKLGSISFLTGTTGTAPNWTGSNPYTLNIPDAGSSVTNGLITNGTQTLSGAKTLSNVLNINTTTTNGIIISGSNVTAVRNTMGTSSTTALSNFRANNSTSDIISDMTAYNSANVTALSDGLPLASISEYGSSGASSRGSTYGTKTSDTARFMTNNRIRGYFDENGNMVFLNNLSVIGTTTFTGATSGISFADLLSKPTTLSGYGITDAVRAVYTSTSTATVSATVTETTIIGSGSGSLTIPASYLTSGKQLRLLVKGVYSTPALSVGNVTVRIKLGGTTLVSGTANALLIGTTDAAWDANCLITCRSTGVSGTVMTTGTVMYSLGNNVAAARLDLNNGTSTNTVNTTASNVLDVTVEYSNNTAGNSISSLNFSLEAVN